MPMDISGKSDYQIYADCMAPLKLGLALWDPAPHFSLVRIGDVGYFYLGGFQLLFNAGDPVDGKIYGVDVPEGHIPLSIGPIIDTVSREPGPLSRTYGESSSVRGQITGNADLAKGKASFSCEASTSEGALLLTKHKTKRYDAQRQGLFEAYILKYYQSWFKFAKQGGHPVKSVDQLVLVTGCDMTADFSMFSFAQNNRNFSIEFEISASHSASASASWGHWKCHSPHVHKHCGPQRAEKQLSDTGEVPVLDQCVFVRGLRVFKRPLPMAPVKLQAAAEPEDPDASRKSDQENEGVTAWMTLASHDGEDATVQSTVIPSFKDPLESLAQHVFENSTAELAILHDCAWDTPFHVISYENIKIASFTHDPDAGDYNPASEDLDIQSLDAVAENKIVMIDAVAEDMADTTKYPDSELENHYIGSNEGETSHTTWTTVPRSSSTASTHGPYSFPPSPLSLSFHLPYHHGWVEVSTRANKKLWPNDYDEPIQEEKDGGPGKADAANRRPACTRCKGSNVKCEPSLEDPDTCKRCYRRGGECTISGRKKRQPPPKRELLVNQIRERAEKIKTPVSELEEANKRVRMAQAASVSSAPSPTSTTDFSFISMSDLRLMSPELDDGAPSQASVRTNADVQGWLATARESIRAFDGYINMGGSSVKRDDLVAEEEASDLENERQDDDDDDELAVTVGEANEDIGGDEDCMSAARRLSHSRLSDSPEIVPRKEQLATIATIPSPVAPFGLMAKMSLRKNPGLGRIKSKSSIGGEDDEEKEVCLANPDFFRASPALEKAPAQNDVPHILRSGLITIEEAEKLIKIYWDYMNLSVSLLDPVLYTMEYLVIHSHFLFTVICGIASRFYTEKSGLYQKAMHYARLAAGTALTGGQKSVDVVHAYILLALYPVPSRKWEDDRSWIYLGVAIRIATDLNLHHPITANPRDEMHARVMLNRTRVWLNCFNLDRSTGSQYGKAPIINNNDFVANRSGEWWDSSPYNMAGFDIHLACHNADLTIMGRFRNMVNSDKNSPKGFNKNLDIADIASRFDDELAQTWSVWIRRVREHTDPNDPQCKFRTGLLRLAYSYSRTTILSWGFQYAFGKSNLGRDVDLLNRCLCAAMDVLASILDEIAVPEQKIFLRHGPEAQSVFVTFACAFLIKLLQPRYASYLDRSQRQQIRDRVRQIIDLLGSPEVAIDDQHSPKVYSRFLQGLLDKAAARLDHSPGPHRKQLKAKSESPMVQKIELHDGDLYSMQSSSNPRSARPSLSLSPEPEVRSPGLLDSYLPSPLTHEPDIMTTDSSPFFAPPLPFNELLLFMDNWSMLDVPGFAWMGSQQTDFRPGLFRF